MTGGSGEAPPTRIVVNATVDHLVSTPNVFDFSDVKKFGLWLRRFERFRDTSGLKDKPEETQVNTLIYSMGEQAEAIFDEFALSATDAKLYNVVVEKFRAKFEPEKNTIFERQVFYRRTQLEDEDVQQFITQLHKLAES
jgi:hypothetical protein